MATQTSLNELIEAIAGAVTDAQERIEQYQVAHLSDFFDEDNRPKSVVIRMPSMHPQAVDGDEDLVVGEAPHLGLRQRQVHYKDFRCGLSCMFSKFALPGSAEEDRS